MGFDPIDLAMAKAYTDSQRLAYVAYEKKPLFDTVVMKAGEKTSILSANSLNMECYARVGETYIVTVNGVSYEVVAEKPAASVDFTLGHPRYETGLPFYIVGSQSFLLEVHTSDADGERTISCELVTETIHPIDPKYLPGVCLPVVKLSENLYWAFHELIELTAAEGAALDAAYETGLPCVIQYMFREDEEPIGLISDVAYRGIIWEYPGFFLRHPYTTGLVIGKINGLWVCGSDENFGDGEGEVEDGEDA